jgi:hypothetical protein
MVGKRTISLLAALMVFGFAGRADALDIKDWSLVCTRHVIGRIAALAKSGDTSEAYAISRAAGDLCGDPIPNGAGSIMVFDSGGELVNVLLSMDPHSKLTVMDRWTPKWNLTTGKGEIAARRESREKIRANEPGEWAKHCNSTHANNPDLRTLCWARPF